MASHGSRVGTPYTHTLENNAVLCIHPDGPGRYVGGVGCAQARATRYGYETSRGRGPHKNRIEARWSPKEAPYTQTVRPGTRADTLAYAGSSTRMSQLSRPGGNSTHGRPKRAKAARTCMTRARRTRSCSRRSPRRPMPWEYRRCTSPEGPSHI